MCTFYIDISIDQFVSCFQLFIVKNIHIKQQIGSKQNVYGIGFYKYLFQFNLMSYFMSQRYALYV